jgi:hypothetical protein
MSFAVHTFESNPESGNLGFSFHENIAEGQELYFLARFHKNTTEPKFCAETIFGALVDSFQKSTLSDAYDRFEDALKATNLEAKKIMKNMPRKPEIVVAFFDFHNLYLSVSDQAEAYLVRGTNVSQISESPESGDDLFLNILSGQVAIEDTILLSTSRILRALTTNQLSDIFARQNFDEAVGIFRHELSVASEEDILVTAIGVGKKESGLGGGFLSKMVTKAKEAIPKSDSPAPPKSEPQPTPFPRETQPEENLFEDETSEELPNKVFATNETHSTKKNVLQRLQNFRPSKNLLIIAGVILATLCIIVIVNLLSGIESEETVELREELNKAQAAFEQADTLLLQGERGQAAELLSQAEESALTVLNSKSNSFRSNAQFLLAGIEEKKLQVENAKKVTPQLVADLGVKNDNLEAVGLMELQGSFFVYDLQNVYKTVRNIVENGLPVSENETILAADARKDQNTLLFLTNSPRIIEYREGLITPMGTEDDAWKRGIDIKTYGRYAYVLDPVDNQIWKYERRRAKYSEAIAYNQGADLSLAVSMAIDGAIYVLSDDGSIQKIFRGVKADYAFKDLPSIPFMGKNLKIYTTVELSFLYVLDPDNKRVLVFEKGDRFATYKKQVLFDTDNARDFYVDESGQKVSVLTRDKIYEFSL